LNDKPIIGMLGQVYRMNYLPSEDDAIFSRGIAKEPISIDAGIVGPDAACLFTGADGRTRLAFLSLRGLMQSDGRISVPATEDIDWSAILNSANLSKAKLENKPDKWELVLYYADTASGVNKRLHFNYHPKHLKGPYLKVSGPVIATTATSDYTTGTAVLQTDTGYTLYTAFSNGDVYYDDDAAKIIPDGAGSTIRKPFIRTRTMYEAGMGGEWRLSDVLVDQTGQSSSMTMSLTPYVRKVGAAESAATAKTFTTALTGLSIATFNISSGGIALELTDVNDTGNKFSINQLILTGEDFGKQEARP
jgi:hypothetical protein